MIIDGYKDLYIIKHKENPSIQFINLDDIPFNINLKQMYFINMLINMSIGKIKLEAI